MKPLVLLALFYAHAAAAQTIFVDAVDASRGVFHSHLTIPLTSGPATLVYPKWIPGEHMPSGPLMQMAGLHLTAAGKELSWRRDPVDMFAFHFHVPAGASAVEVDLDYLSPMSAFTGGYGQSPNATQKLLLVLFNHLILYPAGIPADGQNWTASLRLPAGWKFDTALPVKSRNGDRIEFEPVSLTTLIDSPVVAGLYQRTIPIADEGREQLTLTADSASALAIPEDRVANLRDLVAEADALFGARHFNRYRWLVTLSDLLGPQGLEHHQSTDIRQGERGLTDPDLAARTITILSHEYVHSWNGKYRRPSGLATSDYQQPMTGELLFVYEGMTRYFGDLVLSARSGMRSLEQDREYAAWVAANQDRNRPGRKWRSLGDTAVAAQSIAMAPAEEVPYRRALDYYDESMLLWLEVDTTIRRQSNGRKSLDDFAKLFFGSSSSGPAVKPYTLEDVAAALDGVVPGDWRSFLETRVDLPTEHPPLAALDASGWRLVYNDVPNWFVSLRERTTKTIDASFSLGMWVKNDGTVSDVVYGGPAAEAGLVAGMKITAVNGRKFDGDVLREEIHSRKPLEVSVEQASFAGVFSIRAGSGEQFPHLQRIEGREDLLSAIMRPRAANRKLAVSRRSGPGPVQQ